MPMISPAGASAEPGQSMSEATMRDPLILRMAGDISIAAPADLKTITTYVLLEQEDWFEKELAFLRAWLRPGMTVVDIGANIGVFALTAARLAASVHAYEPTGASRAHLQAGITANGFGNIHLHDKALSDQIGDGWLRFGASSELNALGKAEDGVGEAVPLGTLDDEAQRQDWGDVDFLKIDAEGAEAAIIMGGSDFISRQSPLILMEMKAGRSINTGLADLLRQRGFALYRCLPDTALLLPVAPDEALDDFELDLFAAKPDRAAALAAQGFLADPGAILRVEPDHAQALQHYAQWRNAGLDWRDRATALLIAQDSLRRLCKRAPSLTRLSSLMRVCWESGARGLAARAAQLAQTMLRQGSRLDGETFLPALARFDGIDPAQAFLPAFAEAQETISAFSGFFAPATPMLEWLCNQPDAPAAMLRRHWLRQARAGKAPAIPDKLLVDTPDHLNAALWHDGSVSRLATG
ncbi:FkbM family methyltransferase [Ferrovibrio sp.]|uniref:FkbM family methyltransferase n=1 Tax=Ferrovibrio sp. TaxID=1917215 RepID=UPI0035AF1284